MDPTLMPMLCQSGSIDVVPESTEWAMEPKLDGWRAIVHHTPAGKVRLWGGRNGNEYTGQLPYLEEQLRRLTLPDTVLDGELIAPDGWGGVQGVMTAGSTARAARVPITYWLFDMLRRDGVDLRGEAWMTRRAWLDQLLVEEHDNVDRTVWSFANPAGAQRVIDAGGEGVVLKRVNSRYVNSRSSLWAKHKAAKTCEAVITGFKPGKKDGQWDGKVGAFEVRLVDNGADTTVKCGTNDVHEDATAHPEHWLGVTIEITHNGLFSSGVPRHPRFFRRRDDRNDQAPARRTTTTRRAPVAPTNTQYGGDARGGSGRNYGAMGDDKLLRCIRELTAREGDAFNRCASKSADPDVDLSIATNVARTRGLALTA